MGATKDTVGQRIGVIGGSFDPIHLGHLLAAEQCREQLQLDEVRFVLAATSPFKLTQGSTAKEHRWQMLQLAVNGNPYFRADDRELRRGGTSYTVDTLREILSQSPQAEIVFLMGADSLVDFDKWREPAEICRLAFVAVVARGGFPPPDLTRLLPFLPPAERDALERHLVRMPQCEISSSDIRRSVAEGRSIRYQVPPAVVAYIDQHQLFREPGSAN
ncbi:MAG: nicotinate-nucleotide adenylyltransferase [Aureliella sp.]